ncbi:MAG: ATP-binding cassette domain-containing protein [Fuerstiella sp.]
MQRRNAPETVLAHLSGRIVSLSPLHSLTFFHCHSAAASLTFGNDAVILVQIAKPVLGMLSKSRQWLYIPPMALLSINQLTFTYSNPTLLDEVTLHVERGERIGLVGRNGAGKSTLLKLINRELVPDDGSIEVSADVVVAKLAQEVPDTETQSAFSVAAGGFDDLATAVADYRRLNLKLQNGEELNSTDQTAYEDASMKLADAEQWDAADRLEGLLAEMQLPADDDFSSLSAGMKRRVLLAQAMIRRPDILLLDEPTNHLDITSILWLQNYLTRFSGTLIFITHDRTFLQDMANRIVEVDRGRLFDWTCDYQTFLKRRDDLLAAEEVAQAHFDRKLAEEEKWIRQGIKARRTRNEGRVRALKQMRQERSERRNKQGTAKVTLQEAERSGRLVAKVQGVTHGYDGVTLIDDFTTSVYRGDRIGIIGPNGIGKSTILKILLGQLQPDSGTIKMGTNLEVAYFDQLRDQLVQNKSARENLGEGKDELMIAGRKRHVMGYLQDFLFAPDRAHTRVEFLSGGERNRLLLAKMFAKPANILVLDEPTNDLDSETLDLLEETLTEFQGTLLLVSHDRSFINNVVTSTIVFEGDGVVNEYDGGYDDWKRQYDARKATGRLADNSVAFSPSEVKAAASPGTPTLPKAKKKLSYKEQAELDELPLLIDELETKQAGLEQQMADPDFYKEGKDKIAQVQKDLAKVADKLKTAFERWEILDG